MHPLRLPDGRLLIPVALSDPSDGFGLVAIGEEHPDYGTWLALSEPNEDPQPTPQET